MQKTVYVYSIVKFGDDIKNIFLVEGRNFTLATAKYSIHNAWSIHFPSYCHISKLICHKMMRKPSHTFRAMHGCNFDSIKKLLCFGDLDLILMSQRKNQQYFIHLRDATPKYAGFFLRPDINDTQTLPFLRYR